MARPQIRLRPQVEDYLRAFGYSVLALWAALFFAYTPFQIAVELEDITRMGWLLVAFSGAVMATIGALTRIDIKLEFPGLLLALLGPVFYTVTRLYLTVSPDAVSPEFSESVSLVVYAFLPAALIFPRVYMLNKEKNRLKGAK